MINRQRGKMCFSTFRPLYAEELPYCFLTPPLCQIFVYLFLVITLLVFKLVFFFVCAGMFAYIFPQWLRKLFHANSYEAENTCLCGWLRVRSHMLVSYHRHQETHTDNFHSFTRRRQILYFKRSVACKGDPLLMSWCEDDILWFLFSWHEDKTESPHFLVCR